MNIKMSSNLEGVAGIIGTFRGISDAMNDDRVIQDILLAAHNKTLDKFNLLAAQKSRAARNLNRSFSHMYEFGTAGITPGTTVFTDATRPEARLWWYQTTVSNLIINTNVMFRDAKIPNPKPSQRPDLKKLPREVVARMSDRKYIFKKRATLVESGATITISPTTAKALIFPSRESDTGYGFEHDNIRVNLGGETTHGRSKHKMAFTNFFNAWVNTVAENEVRTSAHNSLAARIGHARRRAKKAAGIKPPSASKPTAAAAAAAAEAKRNMMRGLNE